MAQAQSPITQIFNGQMRSILKCTGRKDSITTEPFLALQLDITVEFFVFFFPLFLYADTILFTEYIHINIHF
jgi:hypothetical protein